jgi:hypothetical protein
MRKVRAPRPTLDVTAIQASIVKPEVVAQRRRVVNRDSKARTPAQLSIDKLVKATYDAWVKAGKPVKWEDRPGANVRIPNVQVETLTAAVHSSTRFLSEQEGHPAIKASFGHTNMIEVDGKRFADMVFTVTEKPAKDGESAAPAPAPAAAAAATAQGDKSK